VLMKEHNVATETDEIPQDAKGPKSWVSRTRFEG
jgi:hypothetical protein